MREYFLVKCSSIYLDVNDPEEKSTLSSREKVKLVIEAIAETYFPSKKSKIQLKRTKKNKLKTCSRNEILIVLDRLETKENIVKVNSSTYPYEPIPLKLRSKSGGNSHLKRAAITPKITSKDLTVNFDRIFSNFLN
jgi:hypothetical protein